MKSFVHLYPVIALLAIDLGFAICNILLKMIVSNGTDHLVFITYRQLISAVFLFTLAFFLERKSRPKVTLSILCQLFVSAIIGSSLSQYLFLLGVEYTSATFSCAFLNMIPVVTFLLALPFRLETLNMKSAGGIAKVLGTLVCLGGAILLSAYKGIPLFNYSPPESADQHNEPNPHIGRERWVIGSLALFAGTLCWSSWFILQSNIGKKYPCQYSSTAIMTFFSAVQSAVLCLSFQRELSVWILKTEADVLIALYAGIVASGLCFVGMSWCVGKRGPVFTAAFSPLVQIMSAVYEVPVLHEQLYLGSLIGSIAVIAGLYMLLWGKDKETLRDGIEEIKDPDPKFQPTKLEV